MILIRCVSSSKELKAAAFANWLFTSRFAFTDSFSSFILDTSQQMYQENSILYLNCRVMQQEEFASGQGTLGDCSF